MSFTYATPRGYSENLFIPDEEWNLGYFIQHLTYEKRNLCFSGDYISGRLIKTDITCESGGKLTIVTWNRGKEAERWVMHLKGEKHIKQV